jgi:uncharacterized membrane protein
MPSRNKIALALAATLFGSLVTSAVPVTPAEAATRPAWTKNCTQLNKKYPHGVGKVGANDQSSGRKVTNFKKSNSLYRTAMSHNRGLDRDGDGIACEKV